MTTPSTPPTTLHHSHANPEQDANVRAMHAAMVVEAQMLTTEAPVVLAALNDLNPGPADRWISRASWVLNQVVTGG